MSPAKHIENRLITGIQSLGVVQDFKLSVPQKFKNKK